MIDVSVIIPSYRETESSLRKICSGVKKALDATDFLFEIILVDDVSDAQHRSVLKLFEKYPSVRCIYHNGNNNQSRAYNAGLEKAEGKYIVLIDADMDKNAGDIPAVLKELENGYSFVQGNRLNRDATATRRIFSWGFNVLVSFVKMERVRDIGCGFIGFPRTVLEHAQSYPGRIKDLVMLIMLKASPVRKVDIMVHNTGTSSYKLKNLVTFSIYLIDHLLEYFWITKIRRQW